MPPTDHQDQDEERRRADTRIARLEFQYMELKSSIEKVMLEQEHVRELFGQRFKSVELLLDGISKSIDQISKAVNTVAELANAVKANGEDIHEHRIKVESLITEKDQLKGILSLIQWMGIGGLVAVAIGLYKVFTTSGHP